MCLCLTAPALAATCITELDSFTPYLPCTARPRTEPGTLWVLDFLQGLSNCGCTQVVQQRTVKCTGRRRWGSCSVCAISPPNACATWQKSLRSTSPSVPPHSLSPVLIAVSIVQDQSLQPSWKQQSVGKELYLLSGGVPLVCRMHLRIQVDIHSLQGTVCAWVPPPPNDRLWFGFITAPELKAEVTPIVANDVNPITFLPCCMPGVLTHRPMAPCWLALASVWVLRCLRACLQCAGRQRRTHRAANASQQGAQAV